MIVWLASYPKSGNTWIRLLITHYFSADKNLFENIKKIKSFPKKSQFDEIINDFSSNKEIFNAKRIGPTTLNKMENAIASLIKIGDLNQLFQPKFLNGYWFILKKDNVLKAEFNHQQKIKLSLELGDKFLHNRFIENQKNKVK